MKLKLYVHEQSTWLSVIGDATLRYNTLLGYAFGKGWSKAFIR